jgi:hypothetical protein
MPIRFVCPSCNHRLKAKSASAGKLAKCRKCGHRCRIPQPNPVEPVQQRASDTTSGECVPSPKAAEPDRPRKCPKCGCEPTIGSSCWFCGFNFGWPRPKQSAASRKPDAKPATDPTWNIDSGSVFVVVLLLFVFIWGCVFVYQESSNRPSPRSIEPQPSVSVPPPLPVQSDEQPPLRTQLPSVSEETRRAVRDQMIRQGVDPLEAEVFTRELYKAEREHRRKYGLPE